MCSVQFHATIIYIIRIMIIDNIYIVVWNWTLQYMAMLFSIKETFGQSKPIHFSMLIRALKWETNYGTKINQGTFRIDKNLWLNAS